MYLKNAPLTAGCVLYEYTPESQKLILGKKSLITGHYILYS